MDNTILLGMLSGEAAIVVATLTAGLTYALTKRWEREADWRKAKLDLYKTHIVALSGVVQSNRTPEDQARHADAVNGLMLVAPPTVLQTLYRFQETVSDEVEEVGTSELGGHLNALLNSLRNDIYHVRHRKHGKLAFRLMSPPPHPPNPHVHPSSGP